MKRFDLMIDRYQALHFLKAVRAKRDIIVLWMTAIKSFLVNQPTTEAQSEARLSIVIMSMSRLFCELNGGGKIFSISFPFAVRFERGEYTFTSREGVQIDNRVSSQIIALVESGTLQAADFSHFIDPIIEAVDVDPLLWSLFRELMLAEDAYIRYDWDLERIDGHRHPEHHLDLYYSQGSSFKIGLRGELSHDMMVSILNIESDCHYLRPALE
ncbi:hypothetical protein [Janthinobacterium kumbetense]|uniref:Uncharacterized protein n=1 Tax=Janthinobacterium kumbetense TaxID=2950280 RepID=A0ABT0WQP6_9BURK|nr:hypothetical protein [Janthinobacterium kumbetense]MCM2566288.1 hypothetical protein [Janthinobacterium kumbetense]